MAAKYILDYMTDITKCPPETVSSNPNLQAFYSSVPIVFFCFSF